MKLYKKPKIKKPNKNKKKKNNFIPSIKFNSFLENKKKNNNKKPDNNKENNRIIWANLKGLSKNQTTKDENDIILKCNIK